MKKCPFCGEKIQDQAKKCRFCGEWLDKENEIKTDKKESKSKIKKESTVNSKKEIDPMKKAEYNIKVAFVVSLITIGLSVILYLIDLSNGTEKYGMTILDILIFIALSFGIYKKSRVASIGAFSYFILGKIVQIVSGTGVWSGILRAILFGLAYFKGIQGTIEYHKLIETKKLNPWEIVLAICVGIIILLAIVGLFMM